VQRSVARLQIIGPLAHAWLEQRTHNPLVPCSTHGRPTTNKQQNWQERERVVRFGVQPFFV
jgi:hypothetical protein